VGLVVLDHAIGADIHFADFAFDDVGRAQVGAAFDAVGDARVRTAIGGVSGVKPGFLSAGHKRFSFSELEFEAIVWE
jgi:hypothetical protein